MSSAARSIVAFGLYLALGGSALVFAPQQVCDVLRLPPGNDFWIRLNGMFFWILAYYCLRAACAEQTAFISWSLWPRSATTVFMAVFVAMGLVGPMALLFGAVDVLAALWTARALRADRHPTGAAAARRRAALFGTS